MIKTEDIHWWNMLLPIPPKGATDDIRRLRAIWQVFVWPMFALASLGITLGVWIALILFGPVVLITEFFERHPIRFTGPEWVKSVFYKK